MTSEEAKGNIRHAIRWNDMPQKEALDMALNHWSEEPCEDASPEDIETLPPVTPQPKTGHCKDCKWWKDSDGVYRRGVKAESQCPINRREVFEGNGYCYLFEPQESAYDKCPICSNRNKNCQFGSLDCNFEEQIDVAESEG